MTEVHGIIEKSEQIKSEEFLEAKGFEI